MTKVKGIVVSGYGGFYQVRLSDQTIVNCKARGRLKKDFSKIYSGDQVEIMLLADNTGMIEAIGERRNYLPRPNIVNVDQIIIVLAWDYPKYDLLLLDRMLVIAQRIGIKPLICFNKIDLIKNQTTQLEQLDRLKDVYQQAGFPIITISLIDKQGAAPLKPYLAKKITVLAGQSGVGKSSILNDLIPDENAEVGQISDRLRRGKHTTRYTRIIKIPDSDGFIADTPGFLIVELPEDITTRELIDYYPDFTGFGPCRFDTCLHDKEPDCAIKAAVSAGKIDADRYQRYLRLKAEIEEKEVQ